MLSTRTKILYGNLFWVGYLSLNKPVCFIWRLGRNDQWEPLRREECIRTVFYYYKGSQVNMSRVWIERDFLRSCVSWRRLHLWFGLIIIKNTSNSQKYIFGWLRSMLGSHFAFVYSVNRSLYSFSQTKRFLNSIWAEMLPPQDQDVHQYIEEIDR